MKNKKYNVNDFRLWKNDGRKWYFYSTVFSLENKQSLSYQNALRLIDKGWIPYQANQHPETGYPLKLEGSYEELENIINQDTNLILAGKFASEFINRTPEEKKKKQEILHQDDVKFLEDVEKKALAIAIERFKKGLSVPPHLAAKVIQEVLG